jgi:DNA-binding MarR family transcriptional regulator
MSSQIAVRAELSLWRDIVILRRKIERELEQRLQQDAGVSVADFEILTTLRSAPDGRLRARDLADVLGWEKSRLSHQVTRMEGKSLVERQDCPTDLRGTWVVITEQGHSAADRGESGYAEVLTNRFDVLDESERTELDSMARRVVQASDPAACDSAEAIFGAS